MTTNDLKLLSPMEKKVDQTMSNELTKDQKWRPTPHMLLWFDTAVQLLTDNISEISASCKISRTAWYEWLKDDKFLIWFKENWDKRLSGEGWKLDVIGLKNAKKDYKYWSDMQKRVGNLQDTSTPVNIDQRKQIIILDGSEINYDELRNNRFVGESTTSTSTSNSVKGQS